MSFASLNKQAGLWKGNLNDKLNSTPGPHSRHQQHSRGPTGSPWSPRNWSRRKNIGAIIGIVVIVIVVIVVAVVEARVNAYPSYTTLDYQIKATYEGTSFFDGFDYFSGYDPTQGFVHYVDQAGSVDPAQNLTFASPTSAIIRVDTSDRNASTGRRSVRIQSKAQYDTGLFIFDILHTPYGCGTWPALWTTDASVWPSNGEIDVLEAVNTADTGNQMSLHTTNGCSMSIKRKETGKVLTTNCYNGTDGNAGCGVKGAPDTYGQVLNNNGGGVYVMELRVAGIRIWFFPRSSVPASLNHSSAPNSTSASPDPSTWPPPLADFPSTHCSIPNHFRNQSIIANIDLCGSWAGQQSIYAQQAGCPGTCAGFVATNATAFNEAYWEFKSFRVYQAV